MKLFFRTSGVIVANDRIGALKMANGLIEEIEKRTGQKFSFNVETHYDDGPDIRPDPEARAEAGPGRSAAADDFPDDLDGEADPAADAGSGEGRGLGRSDEVEPAGGEPVKRRRGRPPSSGKAASGSEQARGGSDAGRPAQARGGDGHDGTAQGEGQERRRADEGARGAGAAPAAAVGDRGSDQEQAGVAGEVDWDAEDEEHPPLTKKDVNRALSRLFEAMGTGAQRAHVTNTLADVTGGLTQVADIPEEGYAKVILAIEAEVALYRDGKKKISKTA